MLAFCAGRKFVFKDGFSTTLISQCLLTLPDLIKKPLILDIACKLESEEVYGIKIKKFTFRLKHINGHQG